jgi:hypothetical protein
MLANNPFFKPDELIGFGYRRVGSCEKNTTIFALIALLTCLFSPLNGVEKATCPTAFFLTIS